MDRGFFKNGDTMSIYTQACMLLLMMWGCAVNSTEYEQYLQAHKAYAQGDYEQSITLLSGLPQKSAAVLYNLGWSYYKQQRLYEALVCFKKAACISWGTTRIQADRIYRQLQQQLNIPDGMNPYVRTLIYWSWYIPTLLLQVLTLIVLILMLICMYYGSLRIWIIPCIVLSMLSGLVYIRYDEETACIACTKQPSVTLYAGPSDTYAPIGNLQRGTELRIDAREDNWYRVRAGGAVGWLAATDVECVL